VGLAAIRRLRHPSQSRPTCRGRRRACSRAATHPSTRSRPPWRRPSSRSRAQYHLSLVHEGARDHGRASLKTGSRHRGPSRSTTPRGGWEATAPRAARGPRSARRFSPSVAVG
jgi:hypothetical protein